MRTDRASIQFPITMNDLKLIVQKEAVEEVDKDVRCDSTFLLEKIPEIGEVFVLPSIGSLGTRPYICLSTMQGGRYQLCNHTVHWHAME